MAHLDLSDGKMKNVRAVIWKEKGGERLFLVTQELSGGSFTVPGGCKDLEDEDLESALRRELHEELGLEPENYDMVRIALSREYENLYRHYPVTSERYGKSTIMYPFLVHIKKEISLVVQKEEIKDAIWLNETEARSALDVLPHMKEMFEIGIEALGI